MPIVVLTPNDFASSLLPPALQGVISAETWRLICQTVENANNQAHFITCGVELAVCLCFAFPCIFCCHPCIFTTFSGSRLDTDLARLNGTLFSNQRVLSRIDTNVTFNTDLLGFTAHPPINPVMMHAAEANTPMATAVPVNEYYPSQTEPVAAPSSPAPSRQLTLTVPSGVEPGQTLRTQAPDGTIVQVTVPPDAYCGQQLTIQY